MVFLPHMRCRGSNIFPGSGFIIQRLKLTAP